ncbi:MAG: hypothetical protein U0166_22550 [Acidobacteriota bacterium]
MKGCLGAAAAAGAIAVVAATVLGPSAAREGAKFYVPIHKMAKSGRALEEWSEKNPWKPAGEDVLEPEQLARFLEVRRRLDELYARVLPAVRKLPAHAHGLKEAQDALATVGDVIPTQMDAFREANMTPREYHYVEDLVYGRWRAALRASHTHPEVFLAAAREVEVSAEVAEPGVAAKLREVAAELRARKPPAPEGFDIATHELLLEHLESIERYSLDAYRDFPFPPPP